MHQINFDLPIRNNTIFLKGNNIIPFQNILCQLIVRILVVFLVLIICSFESFSQNVLHIKQDTTKYVKTLKPPIPEKFPKELVIHGDKRIDNYFWLNDKKNPKVIEHLNAENNYTNEILKSTEDLQKKLYDEMVGRIKQTDESVPYESDGYFYYTRYEAGKEYPIYCRKKGNINAPEEILLNVNEAAIGYKLYKVSDIFVSPNNKLLAYGVDTSGSRQYVVTFKDLMTGKLLGEVLQNTNGNIVFANDNKTVFYVTNDETVRSYKVFTHVLGTPSNKDIEVYHEKDIAFSTIVSKSKSKNYIFISSYSTLSSEVRYLKTDDINGEFKLIQPRRPDLLYYPENWGDKFILRTNNNARNFKIVEVSVNSTTMDNWKDFVPYNKDVLIENFEISKNYLILQEKINGLPQLLIIDIKDKSEHNVKFDEEVYHAYLTDNRNFSSDILRFGYTSLTTPVSIFDYNMQTKDRKLLKETEILGGYNKESYETRRLFATASEGTKIPISLVYKKGIKKDGYNPLLLYGYGSYGASMSPFFSSDRVSLLDRGFIYAIAHVRGGQEMGRHWYEDGKMLKKKNTFTDFISCAEFLISEKYTEPQKLFANGVSAGGLLMGAITNMRPDLFKGIIAEVPWVDVVTDMLDETLPLTSLEWDEWGNPKNKEYYDYMLTYSPYDQVKTQKYPAILATGGLNDTQVPYWSPAKWVAKLRELKIDDNPILLKINMGAGHSGASGRFERYKLIALKYAFMLNMLSINK